MGFSRSSARALHLSNALASRLRRFFQKLCHQHRRLGLQRFRQAQHRTLRRRKQNLDAVTRSMRNHRRSISNPNPYAPRIPHRPRPTCRGAARCAPAWQGRSVCSLRRHARNGLAERNLRRIHSCRKSLRLWTSTVSWFGKPPTRMPEALWFSFNPPVKNPKYWSYAEMRSKSLAARCRRRRQPPHARYRRPHHLPPRPTTN